MYENPQLLSLDESLVDEAFTFFEDFAVGQFGSCNDLFNNNNEAAAVAPPLQKEGIDTMHENPQSLSLGDESLLDEASMSFGDFAAGQFGSSDNLFNINNEAATAAALRHEGIEIMYENPQSLSLDNESVFITNNEAVAAAVPQHEGIGTMYEKPQSLPLDGELLGDFTAGQFGSYVNLFNISNEAVAAAPQQKDFGTMYGNLQSPSLNSESFLDEAPMFFRDFAVGRFAPYDYLVNTNNIAAAASLQQEGTRTMYENLHGNLHGENDRKSPKMKKNQLR